MKKVIAWLLALALTAAVSIGATLAYLTDTDEDVNVMTLGKVKIDQLEYERIDDEKTDEDATVQEFHDNKPLYPGVYKDGFDFGTEDNYVNWDQIGKDEYTSGIWNPDEINNELDKMVFVKNKGDYDAYVRSVFAFEAGNYANVSEFEDMVHLNRNTTDWTWEWMQDTPVTIGGSTYFIATATYNKVLEPGALTEISLSQIALDKTATNEDVEAFGDTYQVLVKSQGIQADGFDRPNAALNEGFGLIDADNIPWENDNPTKGIDLKKALHYYEGGTTKITSKVSNVVFGLNEDYEDITANYTGTLVDVEQDVPVYAYYVPNGSNYDVYLLANDVIYTPKNSTGLFRDMSSLVTIDTYNMDVSRTEDMNTFIYNCKKLTTIDVSHWDTSSVTSMRSAFRACTKLQEFDVTNWDVSNVTSFHGAFVDMESVTELNVGNWDTSSATTMQAMFEDCTGLTWLNLAEWDVSNVETFQSMFRACTALVSLDVSNWDVSNVTSMQAMFCACYELKELDVTGWDVSKVDTFANMFASEHQNWGDMKLEKLIGTETWNPASATKLSSMFYGCGTITDLNLSGWNMPKLTHCSHMFADCYNLKNLDLSGWQTPSLKIMDAMFNNCEVLESIDMSSFDTSNVTEFSQMFEACYALNEIKGIENWNTAKGASFAEMFSGCKSLKVLDLSSFNTRGADETYQYHYTHVVDYSEGYWRMFNAMPTLEKLVLSADFSFDGDGKVTTESYKVSLPAPNNAEGKWYDADGNAYLPSEIPEETAATYYAVNPVNP